MQPDAKALQAWLAALTCKLQKEAAIELDAIAKLFPFAAVVLTIHAALPSEAEASVSVSDIGAALRLPPDPAMGDLAFPCFMLAKPLRKAPPHIAVALAPKINADAVTHARILDRAVTVRAEAAGPYVNLWIGGSDAA